MGFMVYKQTKQETPFAMTQSAFKSLSGFPPVPRSHGVNPMDGPGGYRSSHISLEQRERKSGTLGEISDQNTSKQDPSKQGLSGPWTEPIEKMNCSYEDQTICSVYCN